MSTAASAGQLKAMKMPESPSTMHVNMKLHKLGDIQVGKTMKMHVTGKVVSHNHDQYGHSMRVEIHRIEQGEPRHKGD